MPDDLDRKTNAILKIISESREPIGSVEISEKLKEAGIDMPERTVRYHLKKMSDEGLMNVHWKEGRMITNKGKDELSNSLVSDKVGFMSQRIETMAYKMDFDIHEKSGQVILNISFIQKADLAKALKVMAGVYKQKLGMGEMVAIIKENEEINGVVVPAGKIALGTLCSINLNGILLKHAIPVESEFGGLLQIEDGRPLRFTDIINYSGSTLDPHEIFLKSKMTSVREAAAGAGKILAGLREIPAASKDEAEAILRRTESAGIGRALMMGKPGQTVLGMPVGVERVGIVVPGGLNPIAAVEEAGIETESKALVTMVDYGKLINFFDI
ncbi:MAG: NrpR regulatory domain-containing protein [Candidatus Margulisbacteria bacterium]|nr:NrpR regulatory domain-containing protein [Candidatus Margulisiibacteriota bacterium]